MRATSTAAADSIKPHVQRLQALILDALRTHGPMTDEEMQERCVIQGSTQRPRRGELERLGLVADTGDKRKTKSGRLATVWTIVPAQLGLGFGA